MVDGKNIELESDAWDVDSIFEDGGLLAKHFPSYQRRGGQIRLAKEVESALASQTHRVLEGACGTGKTLSYLVPTIHHCLKKRSRAVVCTANIALQEQLYKKDLPLLASILPEPFQFSLVKGRSNYFCLRSRERLKADFAQGEFVFGQSENPLHQDISQWYGSLSEGLVALCDWSKRTETGDRSELEEEPSAEDWSRVSSTAEECLREACPFRADCFAELARGNLSEMQIIVVNYHVLMAAASLRKEIGQDVVLPPFDVLICDEAHKIADIARSFFGWDISMHRLSRLSQQLQRRYKQAETALNPGMQKSILKQIASLEEAIPSFGDALLKVYGQADGAYRLRSANMLPIQNLANLFRSIRTSFKDIGNQLNSEAKAECGKHAESSLKLADELQEISSLGDENGVYFLEKFGRKRNIRASKRMINVSNILSYDIFAHTKTTIATSATMAIRGSCAYVKHEIGLHDAPECVVGSPFDFQRQGLLITSANAPDPQAKDFADRVSIVMHSIIDQAKGRTLGLFTSYRVLKAVAEYLRNQDCPYSILVQGEKPRMSLVKEFKEDTSSVLLGTESFWAGVDVPGEALSCLVIDKIPFPSPGDPVLEAMQEAAGGFKESFFKISIPRAVLQMRQGAGRLIRSERDRGVLVVLDRRLVTKGYGSIFIQSLPPMRRASSMRNGEIRDWLSLKESV